MALSRIDRLEANVSRHILRRRRNYGRWFNTANTHVKPSDAVSDATISDLASKPLHPLTLADLVRHGRPPLPTSALYNSANFSLSRLPQRLAHRIKQIRNLPYIVVTNPHVAKIHNNYVHTLSTLLPYADREISTPADEEGFTEVLAGLVQTHSNTIPTLARGLLESRRYVNADDVTRFLDEHLRARIGSRLIAEQHIALHYASKPAENQMNATVDDHDDKGRSTYVGIIDTALRPATIVSHCESFVGEICELNYGVRPSLIISGDPETRIAHVPVHLEYIITELLKNAFRATIEKGTERDPIEVTIAPSPAKSVEQEVTKVTNKSQGEKSNLNGSMKLLEQATPGVTIRIRDRGGGISPENHANLWNYGFTTFDEQSASNSNSSTNSNTDALNVISGASAGVSSLAGLGYGLPLGRAYAEYFGGGIALQSLWGWGTDVYLTLRGVGSLD